MRSKSVVGSWLVVGALLATACGGGGGDTDGADGASSSADGGEGGEGGGDLTVTAGVIGPESSPAALYWTELERGFELGAEEALERYGVTFEAVERDTRGEPERAAQLIQELLNQEQVDVIFGPSLSGEALQVAPVIQRTGRPWMTGIPVADAIIDYSEQPNWAFRTNYNNEQTIEAVGDVAFGDGQSVAMLYGTDGFGQAGYDAVAAWAEANGHDIVAAEGIDPGSPDMSPQLNRVRGAGADTIVSWFTTGADQATMMRGLEQLDFDADVVTQATVMDPAFVDLATPEQWEGMVFPAPMDFESEALQDLVAEYEERFGEPPLVITGVWSVYAATLLYAQAVSEVGDPSDYEAVRQAIEDTAELEVLGQDFTSPFTADDHELFDLDGWFLYEYDADGQLVNLGPAVTS
ncbi:ABC transporter substrate-binding protein [Nitriliruptoraceae bacterium ZYF776]|nr:ABC transporter substrate-binding protein [Profundirhabdus halotolerans]